MFVVWVVSGLLVTVLSALAVLIIVYWGVVDSWVDALGLKSKKK